MPREHRFATWWILSWDTEEPMGRYTVLIFDADETLFDYRRGETYALEMSLTEAGISFRSRDYVGLYHKINSGLWKRFEEGLIGREDLKSERFRQFLHELGSDDRDPVQFGKRYLKHLGDTGFMIDGAKELLDNLAGAYRLALLTNGFSQVQNSRIAKTRTGEYFDTIVISEEVGCQKPQKEIFDLLLERLHHVDRTDVLMIGDSLSSDIRGGNNAGIDTCWYNPEHSPANTDIRPTYEMHDLGALTDLLRA
jgi:2-haloacid dehalogenase